MAPDGSLHCAAMAVSTHTFQAPKGTRDFYPHDLAVRRYIESVWREVSINHGFDEIDGPTFEHLDLYTVKSGPGIESELFSFTRSGGDTKYALRPEFTPTLARMYAAQAGSLPKPTKWFSIGPYFRAERPQRGRLREHIQWNVDFIGEDSVEADADVIACCIHLLRRLGFKETDVWVRISDRRLIEEVFEAGEHECTLEQAFDLLDKRPKMNLDDLKNRAQKIGFNLRDFNLRLAKISTATLLNEREQIRNPTPLTVRFFDLLDALQSRGIRKWCVPDPGIVRGLAYYTSMIFEVIGEGERAIAGGGRYDNLVELFGGPPTAACGFAMGDVVLRLVLADHGLLKPAEQYMPCPDVFVINARDEEPQTNLTPMISELRQAGLHVRHSYKATRNVGKLMSEANKARARFAVILGKELDEGNVVLKDLRSGEQEEIARETLIEVLRMKLAACEGG